MNDKKTKTLVFCILVVVVFVFYSKNSSDLQNAKASNAVAHADVKDMQTRTNDRQPGWQIYEIDYPKTPLARSYAASVYNGRYFYVFSGSKHSDEQDVLNDCWYYDPRTDIWCEISVPEYVKGRCNAKMLCIGDKILIYGGDICQDRETIYFNDGYVLYHKDNCVRWSSISVINAPKPRIWFSAIATNEEMIVFGGINEKDEFLKDCHSYNPESDKWSEISVPSDFKGRFYHNALWTGKEMLITGGVIKFNTVLKDKEESVYNEETEEFETKNTKISVKYNVTTQQSATFNPVEKKWEVFDLCESRTGHTSVWTGKCALLWGGYTSDGTSADWAHNTIILGRDEDNELYSCFRDENILPAREDHIAFWTGKEMLIGFGDNPHGDGESPLYRSGGLYDLQFNKWIIPSNCPFTIYLNKSESQTFMDENSIIYNFNLDNNLTGKYIPDRDIFLTGLGTGFQPKTKDIMFLDTPEGIYATSSYNYTNGRIWTYAFWKFNEKTVKFERIDKDRKNILYGNNIPLWRNKKLCFDTSLSYEESMYCKEGFLVIYNQNEEKWISAHTDGVVPIDRYSCAKAINQNHIFVSGGVFSPIRQYSENFDIAWEKRIPNTHFSLEHWYRPWFNEQSRIAKQSKTYPVLDDGFIYDFKANKWIVINTDNSPVSRVHTICCPFGDGFAIFGGYTSCTYNLFPMIPFDPDIEKIIRFDGGIYNPGSNKWTKIEKLTTNKLKPDYDTFNKVKLSPIGNNLLLYDNEKPWGYYTSDTNKYFWGFVYNTQTKKWRELELPCENAYLISDVVNFCGKSLLKVWIEINHNDSENEYLPKWYIYDADTGKWTECAINGTLDEDYPYHNCEKNESQKGNQVRPFVYKNRLIFYTNVPQTANNEETGRYTLKIYSYNILLNKVSKLSEIETNIVTLNDGTQKERVLDVNSLNNHYKRNRIVFFGYDSYDEYFDEEDESKMYVLIYNFPNDEKFN